MEKGKHEHVLDDLLAAIEKRSGKQRAEQLQREIKPHLEEGLYREILCQILARESWSVRIKFLALYPEYILPYIWRQKT